MTDRVVPPSTAYEVTAHWIADTDAGQGQVTTLPASWIPLSAVRVGEFLVVVCYREHIPAAADPGG